MTWFSHDGKRLSTASNPGPHISLDLSPDEKSAAVWQDDPASRNQDIWIIELVRGVASRLTSDPGNEVMPLWSPDGKQVLFSAAGPSRPNLYIQPASGSGPAERLIPPGDTQIASDWSRDGRLILFSVLSPKTKWDIQVLSVSGERKISPFLQTEFNEGDARFSPDGQWVAYTSDESGRLEVYVRRFPSGSDKVHISTGGGIQPRWRRDGRELYYLAPGGNLMAVDIRSAGGLEPGVPRALFRTGTPPQTSLGFRHYAPSPDGQRFLVNTLVDDAGAAPKTVVVNWAAGLKK